MDSFRHHFAAVADPRAGNTRHDFLEVIFVALAAALCGAEDCTEMALFGRAKLGLLRQVVKLEHGAPSHDTFSRVFRRIAPEPFEAAFAAFMKAFGGALKGVVAIDGKALRGAHARGRRSTPLHLVNIWAAERRMVIGQRLAPGRNEVLGAQQALALLSLEGCIVTADALHCRPDTARAIVATGADYALALKANQPKLLEKAGALVAAAVPGSAASQAPATAHDRLESRSAIVVPAPDIDFPGIAAVARVEARRKLTGQPETLAVRFFLLSAVLTPERMLDVARTHWTIENQLHWVLDVDFGEDAARSRKDHAPQNLAIIRKLALNLIRQHPEKGSIKGKIKRAAWTDDFLLSIFSHMR